MADKSNPTDPRELLSRINMTVDHSDHGMTLSHEDLRLLRNFVSTLYGALEPSVEEYDALCDRVAEKEAHLRDRIARVG